ncbi:protein c12orf4-like [Gigaspora margarita]|uniref:Protein c12orf4-like n=1 Tax=Gigaspora margarita TaxID=4874 RepID=A0A8H3XCV0_GIGMA|nr:protein c12orf4-like [Gigaspora margarita]
MKATKILKDLSINLHFTLPPSNALIKLTIHVKKDRLLLDVVRRFMNNNNIPCYLENSVLSIVETLIEESWRRDIEKASKIDNEMNAAKIREAIVAKYQKHTVQYNDAPAEDIFPKAYNTLVHSPVPSIFDTLLQLEQNYNNAVKSLITSHKIEMGMRERYQKDLDHVGTGSLQNGFSYMSERPTEDIEYSANGLDEVKKSQSQVTLVNGLDEIKKSQSQVTLVNGLDEVKKSQKHEYCEFVIKLYNAHQRWVIEQSTMDSNWMYRVDGKEIVSEVIADMKKHYKFLSNEILNLDQGSRPRSRHSSISSLSEVMLSPTMITPPSPLFPTSSDDKRSAKEEDPTTMKMINDLTEMGWSDKQARVALDMAGGNKEQAANLLIEQLDKIDAQIANGINGMPIIPRRPSTPNNNSSSDHKEQSGSLSLRQKKRRPLTILTKQEKRNTWSPISFFQQKNMLNAPGTPTRRFSGWLGRKDDTNGNVNADNSQLGESFTITLGNQVKSTHNIRLLVSDVDDLLKSSNDPLKEMAHRAQTAANLYSQDLAAIVLLLTPQDWSTYKFGRGANKAFFERCKESTEFHFDDVETQLEAIEKDFSDSHGMSSIKAGDFFITRHSNLPMFQVIFHLVIDFESMGKSNITHCTEALNGLRNILRTVERFDITNISLPFLLLPSNIDCFSDSEKERDLSTRGEFVLKCAKGFMMKNSRVPKHMTVKEQETKTVSFLLPKGASEQQFNSFRKLLMEIFRAN